jgi:hypothetical protein
LHRRPLLATLSALLRTIFPAFLLLLAPFFLLGLRARARRSRQG